MRVGDGCVWGPRPRVQLPRGPHGPAQRSQGFVFQGRVSGRVGGSKGKGRVVPGRALEDGAPPRGSSTGGDDRRRPADVWFPKGVGDRSGQAGAVDFAVTSGLRRDNLRRAAEGGGGVGDDYGVHKGAFLGTKEKCKAGGFQFIPVVWEAHGGGWGRECSKMVGFLAHALECGGGFGPGRAKGRSWRSASRVPFKGKTRAPCFAAWLPWPPLPRKKFQGRRRERGISRAPSGLGGPFSRSLGCGWGPRGSRVSGSAGGCLGGC